MSSLPDLNVDLLFASNRHMLLAMLRTNKGLSTIIAHISLVTAIFQRRKSVE